MTTNWKMVELREVLTLDRIKVPVDAGTEYPMVGVKSFGRGLFFREPVSGNNTSYKYFCKLKAEHIVMSQLFGWEGALALSSEQFANHYVSPQFPTFLCDEKNLYREYLGWFMQQKMFWEDLGSRTKGMGDRRRTLNPEALFSAKSPCHRWTNNAALWCVSKPWLGVSPKPSPCASPLWMKRISCWGMPPSNFLLNLAKLTNQSL